MLTGVKSISALAIAMVAGAATSAPSRPTRLQRRHLAVLSFFSIPYFGHLSDRIGRRNMYLIGAIATGIFGSIYFGLLNTGSLPLIFLAIVLSLVPHDTMYGPQAALIAEAFTGRLRYSGASLGYQLASVIAGGPAPLVSYRSELRAKTAWSA